MRNQNKEIKTFISNDKGLPNFAIKQLEKLRKYSKKSKSVLKLKNVDKIYDNGFQAIFGTSINVKSGEFVSILGPSGCGKTTTLRMIAGLEKVSQGEIFINDLNITSSEPSTRDLTMVFQNYALFPHLTVQQNIEFGLRANKKKLGEGGKIYKKIKFIESEIQTLQNFIWSIKRIDKFKNRLKSLKNSYEKMQNNGFDKKENKFQKLQLETLIKDAELRIATAENYSNNKKEIEEQIQKKKEELGRLKTKRIEVSKQDNYKLIIDEKVKKASKLLELDFYLTRRPSELSGGQRQRVALGRSIVAQPTLFLMDEPLSNLDAKLRSKMRTKIREIHNHLKVVSIYVTHDQIEAMTMSDKIVVMSDGFVQQIGTPKEIYTNPSNLFVANFVGSPSINLIEGKIKNKKFISCDGTIINIPPYKLKNAIEDQEVIIGIRPTDFSTNKIVKNENKKNGMKVKIIQKELLGNEYQYKALLNKNEITFITSSYEDYEIGKMVEILPLLSRVHLFDKGTTISLTSEFNLETLESLNNWSTSSEKIKIRKKIMEKEKEKSNKKTFFSKLKEIFSKNKNVDKK